MSVQSLSNFSSITSPFLSSLVCGQALERQKEYFDCIRNERDELRDELADIKGKAKAGEVGLPKSHKKKNKLKGMSRWPKIELWPKTTFFCPLVGGQLMLSNLLLYCPF